MVLYPLAIAVGLVASPSFSGDLIVYGGAALTFDNEYLVDGDPATRRMGNDANAYVEGEFRHVYAGLSADVLNHKDLDVVDLYLGYRDATAGGVSYDLSYDKSTYPHDHSSDYGTVELVLGLPVGEKLTLGFDGDLYFYNCDWVVTSGVADGDQVIVDGLTNLKDGAKIAPVPVTIDADGVVHDGTAAPATGNN